MKDSRSRLALLSRIARVASVERLKAAQLVAAADVEARRAAVLAHRSRSLALSARARGTLPLGQALAEAMRFSSAMMAVAAHSEGLRMQAEQRLADAGLNLAKLDRRLEALADRRRDLTGELATAKARKSASGHTNGLARGLLNRNEQHARRRSGAGGRARDGGGGAKQ